MSQENSSETTLIRPINRQQMCWRPVDVERLIDEEHLARAIWALVGRLELRRFYEGIESSAAEGGRPAYDPQLLISLWVYAYSLGIGSAREVARRCEYDPAFQWLTGLDEVNYHTLADFRVEKGQELDELFTQVLAALSQEGLVTLEQVMQDGTKIKALVSRRSYQKETTLREHLERARRRVAEMGDPRNEESNPKARPARARARQEQQQRLEKALQELEKLREGAKAKSDARVSVSDPEARVMMHSDGTLQLSYNAQISADAAHGLIVGVAITQEANDSAQLLPAVGRIEQQLKKKPQQIVADGGYTTRDNIEKMAGREIDFLGSMGREQMPSGATAPNRLPPSAFIYQPETNLYVCPEGKLLRPQGRHSKTKRWGQTAYLYEAKISDCQPCVRKPECCPGNQSHGRGVLRTQESAAVLAFREKMTSAQARRHYRRRGRVVEFCHAWIKSKLGLRQFHVRGLAKVQAELLWACLTYNLQQWIRLRKPKPVLATT